MLFRAFERNKLRNRLTAARDDYFLTFFNFFQEPGEMNLCFADADCDHDNGTLRSDDLETLPTSVDDCLDRNSAIKGRKAATVFHRQT